MEYFIGSPSKQWGRSITTDRDELMRCVKWNKQDTEEHVQCVPISVLFKEDNIGPPLDVHKIYPEKHFKNS